MADNMPWDEFTRQSGLVGGDGWDPETAAVGYYTRDRGMPLDNLSNTMRDFPRRLAWSAPNATTIRSAPPSGMISIELAAFTHGQESVAHGSDEAPVGRTPGRTAREDRDEYARGTGSLGQDLRHVSHGGGARAGSPCRRTINTATATRRDGGGAHSLRENRAHVRPARRRTTAARNSRMDRRSAPSEQFPSVIANRMWKRVMGKGVYEPVDEYVQSIEIPASGLASRC